MILHQIFRTSRLGFYLCLVLFLTVACQHDSILEPEPAVRFSEELEDRHPIHVAVKGVEIKLSVRPGVTRLSRAQRRKVVRFLSSFKRQRRGLIEIAAPAGADNELATFDVLKDIRILLKRSGIPSSQVDFIPYNAKNQTKPAIYMTYGKYVAKGPKCDVWPYNLVHNKNNVYYHNFGCAHQSNLAAMIANPEDLLRPRGASPRSSERRDVVIDKYIKGETTASQKSEDEKGTVSDVANN